MEWTIEWKKKKKKKDYKATVTVKEAYYIFSTDDKLH